MIEDGKFKWMFSLEMKCVNVKSPLVLLWKKMKKKWIKSKRKKKEKKRNWEIIKKKEKKVYKLVKSWVPAKENWESLWIIQTLV